MNTTARNKFRKRTKTMLTYSEFSDLCLSHKFKTPVISERDYSNLDYHSEPYLNACLEKASLGYSFEYFASVLLSRYKRKVDGL